MCVVCYLSTDRVIPEIPFNENAPAFNIERQEERPSSAMTKKFVYYCGSRQCCGCGFGNMGITETVLQQTEKELSLGPLSEETAWHWWNQKNSPPNDKERFVETAREIRESHQDTERLYHLIKETCRDGFSCELLVCWSGDEEQPVTQIVDVCLAQDSINIDFESVAIPENMPQPVVLLYRFFSNIS